MANFRSFAKLNLHLEVGRRRDDGFHELRTIFQTIDLADDLELIPIAADGRVELVVSGRSVPVDDQNLAVRAAREFLAAWGRRGEGVSIRLEKRIPVGSGLGGGSSNAATVLLGLAELFERRPDRGWLVQTAARLGADVPFFLVGGTALGLGRGDEIVALEDPPGGGLEAWLAVPPYSVSTAEVFAQFKAPSEARSMQPIVQEILEGRPPASLLAMIGENDLESPAFRLRPELSALYTALASAGSLSCRMSGSGSTIFAVFEEASDARAAAEALPSGVSWQSVATLGRAAWRAASGFAGADEVVDAGNAGSSLC